MIKTTPHMVAVSPRQSLILSYVRFAREIGVPLKIRIIDHPISAF